MSILPTECRKFK